MWNIQTSTTCKTKAVHCLCLNFRIHRIWTNLLDQCHLYHLYELIGSECTGYFVLPCHYRICNIFTWIAYHYIWIYSRFKPKIHIGSHISPLHKNNGCHYTETGAAVGVLFRDLGASAQYGDMPNTTCNPSPKKKGVRITLMDVKSSGI